MAGFSSASRRIDLLPPERVRPVRRSAPLHRKADVVDADFVVVAPGMAFAARRSRPVPAAPAGHTLFRSAERRLNQVSPRVFAGLTVGLCTLAFLLTVTFAPSRPKAETTLGIGQVRTALQDADGLKALVVYGMVVNPTLEPRDIPPIRVVVVASGQAGTAEGQLAGGRKIAPGETRPFSARLPHSGGAAPKVEISFAAADAPFR